MKVLVIIPAYNEGSSIGNVLRDIPRDLVSETVVVDNGSTDDTAVVARAGGATVVAEPQRGYGRACLTGIDYARTRNPDAVVFLDGDYSDFPEQMVHLIARLADGFDLVIGSRVLGDAEKGALLPQARWGNWLAVSLVKLFFGYQYSDLGPFRAISWPKLEELGMGDENFGWTIEMQVKAIRKGLRIAEVPVSYRKRIGVSKVTGTLSGTLRAGYKILYTIFRYYLAR